MAVLTRILSVLAVAAVLFSASAAASMLIPADENARDRAKAPERSPVIDETASGEWGLERVDFIHYAKPENPGSGKAPKVEACYKLMGVKWGSLPVSYVVNPGNQGGLSEGFVTGAVSASADAWDGATSKDLFGGYTVDYSLNYGTQDYMNVISFGDYPQDGVIGVTTVWYTRVGKRIVEFDMLLDTDFTWGDADATAGVMDLQNIVTHELGHSVGMSDLYTSACSGVTMYGYSGYGETEKRTLETPDITGLQQMYGP